MMMAIDIGIKNLAYCIGNASTNDLHIKHWSNVNLLKDPEVEMSKCFKCGKPAKASSSSGLVCTRHVPKEKPQIHDAATGKPIKKLDKPTLKSFLETKGLKTSGTLLVLADRAREVATLPLTRVRVKNARDFAMNTNSLHDAVRNWIEQDWAHLKDVKTVYIEHQPAMKNPTMKTVQIVVYATLRGRLLQTSTNEDDISFHFTHASTKVKGCTGTGDAGYKSRKAFSKSRVLRFLEACENTTENHAWLQWLSCQKKTDDLSDALCMLLDVHSKVAENRRTSGRLEQEIHNPTCHESLRSIPLKDDTQTQKG
jgi:Holliday junction resolvasome RuvABC endonuclease subunit